MPQPGKAEPYGEFFVEGGRSINQAVNNGWGIIELAFCNRSNWPWN